MTAQSGPNNPPDSTPKGPDDDAAEEYRLGWIAGLDAASKEDGTQDVGRGLHHPIVEQMVDEEALIEDPAADDVLLDMKVCAYCFHLLYPEGPDDYYHPDVFWPCPTAREAATAAPAQDVGRREPTEAESYRDHFRNYDVGPSDGD